MSLIIPSIVIPSNDMLIQKSYITILAGISPIEQDSLWFSVIYESWNSLQINIDIMDRINKLEVKEEDEVEKNIENIREAILIMRERLVNGGSSGYSTKILCENLSLMLQIKETHISYMRKMTEMKNM